MTVHKLTAGDGDTHLTRQVASADERRARGQSLADYYVVRGAEHLGVAGTEVSETQMKALSAGAGIPTASTVGCGVPGVRQPRPVRRAGCQAGGGVRLLERPATVRSRAARARGNGIQSLLLYHDLAHVEHLYNGREVARTVMPNATMRILLPGARDLETLRYWSDLIGQTRTETTGVTTGYDGKRISQLRHDLAELASGPRSLRSPPSDAMLPASPEGFTCAPMGDCRRCG